MCAYMWVCMCLCVFVCVFVTEIYEMFVYNHTETMEYFKK